MRFTKDSLKNVSVNMLVHFIENFPQKKVKLVMKGIKWDELYKEKKENKLIEKREDGSMLTIQDQPVIMVCMQLLKNNERREYIE